MRQSTPGLMVPWREVLVGMTKKQEEEIDEYAALLNRLSDLLTKTTNVLKGEPGPRQLHDWSDLPKVAAKAMAVIKATERRQEIYSAISSHTAKEHEGAQKDVVEALQAFREAVK